MPIVKRLAPLVFIASSDNIIFMYRWSLGEESKMYYQGQYRARQGVKSLNTRIKKVSWQLMAVLIIILLLMLLKYANGSISIVASGKIRAMFYCDYTEDTKNIIGQAIPKVSEYFKDIEGKKEKYQNDNPEFVLDYLPVEGGITSEFGERIHPTTGKVDNHTGIDLDAKIGTEVKSVFDGFIEDIIEDKALGMLLVIDHGNGYKTRYAHLSKINAEKGDNVKKGDIIALTGNTGITTGPHLHFEVEVDGKAINPIEFIKAKSL